MRSETVGAIAVMVILILGFIVGLIVGLIANSNHKEAYIEALIDRDKGNSPKYILVDKPNGERLWEENKERKSEK
jgi:hypothetical protein